LTLFFVVSNFQYTCQIALATSSSYF
jgi:hypothetical protein